MFIRRNGPLSTCFRGFLVPFSLSLAVSFFLALSVSLMGSFRSSVRRLDVPPSTPVRFVGFKDISPLIREKKPERSGPKKPKPPRGKLKVYRMVSPPVERLDKKDFVARAYGFNVDLDMELPFSSGPRLPLFRGSGFGVPGLKGKGLCAGSGDGSPVLVTYVKPFYPLKARMMGIEGVVVVKLLVDERGSVEKVEVLRSSPKGVFEDSVVRAVRSWRFIPARENGRPVPCWVVKPIRFKLGG